MIIRFYLSCVLIFLDVTVQLFRRDYWILNVPEYICKPSSSGNTGVYIDFKKTRLDIKL